MIDRVTHEVITKLIVIITNLIGNMPSGKSRDNLFKTIFGLEDRMRLMSEEDE